MIVRFKVQKSNKPTIALIDIVLTFGEIDNKESIIDFQKFQTLWLLKKKSWVYKEKMDLQKEFCLYQKSNNETQSIEIQRGTPSNGCLW